MAILLGSLILFIAGSFLVYWWSKKPPLPEGDSKRQNWSTIDPTLDEVVQAIRQYAKNLPEGVTRSILVKEDHQIDFEPLAPILQGIPAKPFYMSKETYDVFEEADKEIPPILDQVQKAVDLYVKETKQFPVLPNDPLRRVNYYHLLKGGYLKEKPEIKLYITAYDGLISLHPPKKKQFNR